MSYDKLREFEEAAKKAEEEFLAVNPQTVIETKSEEQNQDQPTPEPEPEPQPTPEPVPAEDPEKKYKDLLKGMNEAQRKAAEAAKAKEETDKRLAELEKSYQEILEKAKKEKESTKVSPVEDPEFESLLADLPDVARIARVEAERARKAVEPEIAELRKMLQEERDARAKSEKAESGRQMYQEIVKAHPDYDEVVNSDEMVHWVNNEAPPIFKAIFEGTVPATAKDAITVLNAFKQTTTPTQKAPVVNRPGAAEVAAPVKAPTPIATKPRTDEGMSEAEIETAMKNIHRMSPAEIAALEKRVGAMFNP